MPRTTATLARFFTRVASADIAAVQNGWPEIIIWT